MGMLPQTLVPGATEHLSAAPTGRVPAAQITPICTVAGLPKLDPSAAHIGLGARSAGPSPSLSVAPSIDVFGYLAGYPAVPEPAVRVRRVHEQVLTGLLLP